MTRSSNQHSPSDSPGLDAGTSRVKRGLRLLTGTVVCALLAIGAGAVVNGLHPDRSAAAVSYANAAIADKALSYWGGTNGANWGGQACADAHKPGDSGGQCRAF